MTLVSESDGWAVGYSGAILHWDGATWTATEGGNGNNLYSVSAMAGAGWAVGYSSWRIPILYWNGTGWTMQESPTSHPLHSVAAVSSRDAWAVGAGAVILRYQAEPTAVELSEFAAVAGNSAAGLALIVAGGSVLLAVGLSVARRRRQIARRKGT